ncbi:TonB-dependent receptor [Hyphococcus sp.]|uniref:TonB-dependent receptor n=1 Tax=Hyphococcus sp. TaxID=2038636 RepID=UPI003CCBB88A
MNHRFFVHNKTLSLRTALLGAVSGIACAGAHPAFAQETTQASEPTGDRLVVVARKREENLFEVPVAVTAFSDEQLQAAGMNSLVQIVEFTPGVQFENNSVANPGRIYTDIRFRGLGNELVEPFAQVGSIFLDGVPIVGGSSSIGTQNIERVEVVKGPSSALFGRSTFAGAINYISKTPSLTEFSGTAALEFAQDSTHTVSLGVEGPIIQDFLSARLFIQDYSTGGQYRSSSDGGALGEESTRTYMGTLYAEPTPNLSMKFRGMYAVDDDGPAASVHLGNASSRRGAGPNVANCFAQNPSLATALKRNVPGTSLTDFICGEVPIVNLTDSNTQISSDVILPYFDLVDASDVYPTLTEFGLEREQIRAAFFIDYDINGHTISSVSSFDDERVTNIRDLDDSGVENWINYDLFRNKSFFQELRITSPSDQRFTWMLGGGYFNGKNFGYYLNGGESVVAYDGGMTAPVAFDLDTTFGVPADGICPCGFNGFNPPPVSQNETFSVFGALGYDFTEWLGLDFEWRYQWDDLTQRDAGRTSILPPTEPFATGNGTELGATFKNFLPRVTIQLLPTPTTNFWATYSKGNNPGFFNSRFASFTQEELDLNPDFVQNASLFLDEEEIENWEIGWRQSLLNGNATFSVVAYMMDWTNQKTRTGVLFNTPGGGQQVSTAAVQGFSTDLMGVEFEGSARLTDVITLAGQFTYSDAEFKNFECGFTDDYAPANADGIVDCSGNTPLQFPKWSSSFSLSFLDDLPFSDRSDWSWFGRLDGIYTGKQFTDEQNFSFIGSSWLFNLRGGVQRDNIRFELFVTNLFNEDQYLAGGRTSDFSADTGSIFPFEFSDNQSLTLIPAKQRQFGARTVIDF